MIELVNNLSIITAIDSRNLDTARNGFTELSNITVDKHEISVRQNEV
jgi:hypothetical protein